ncbi:UNVERIFIED_CONTAM: hypothetical protein DES50_102683 [Williamsia faeni]
MIAPARTTTAAIASVVTVVVLAVAGCSSDSGDDAGTTATSQAPPAASSVTPAQQTKEVKVGDTFTVWNKATQGSTAVVTLQGVEVDPPTSWTSASKQPPHSVGLHVLIDMTSSSAPNIVSGSFGISEELPGGLTATTPADQKANGGSFTDGRPKIIEVKKGQKQDGWLLLAVDQPAATLLWPTYPGTVRIAYPQ